MSNNRQNNISVYFNRYMPRHQTQR